MKRKKENPLRLRCSQRLRPPSWAASSYRDEIASIELDLRDILLGDKPSSPFQIKLLITRAAGLWSMLLEIEGASD